MNYLSAENLSKSFGEQILFENLTFGLERGDKTAVGSGHTLTPIADNMGITTDSDVLPNPDRSCMAAICLTGVCNIFFTYDL